MGMFDTIIVDKNFKLPLPENMEELTIEDFYKDYQTKDLEDALLTWTLNENGKITRKETIVEETGEMVDFGFGKETMLVPNTRTVETGNIIEVPTPQIINFYNYVYGPNLKNNYWIEYEYQYMEKEKSIRLVKFKVSDDTENKERQKKHAEEMKKFLARRQKLWYKIVQAVYLKPVRWAFELYRKVLHKMPSSYRIEDFLTDF